MPVNPELQEKVANLLSAFNGSRDELAAILQQVQQQLGYIPPSTVPLIADKTGLTRPEVYCAIELSPSFTLKPAGKHTLYICNAENCCMYGGEDLLHAAEQQLGIRAFETTADQQVRLETFHCFGNCSMSPNVMLDGRVYGMMTVRELDALLTELKHSRRSNSCND